MHHESKICCEFGEGLSGTGQALETDAARPLLSDGRADHASFAECSMRSFPGSYKQAREELSDMFGMQSNSLVSYHKQIFCTLEIFCL